MLKLHWKTIAISAYKHAIPYLCVQPSSWRWTLGVETCRRHHKNVNISLTKVHFVGLYYTFFITHYSLFRHVCKIVKSDCYLYYVCLCLSVCPSTWNNSVPSGWIFFKFVVWGFLKNQSRKFSSVDIWQK